MELVTLFKGFCIGVAVAAPVGPMSVLLMRRTLGGGWRLGVGTGLGIATGDGVYAAVAALGLAGVSKFMLAYDRPLHLLAGAYLLYLGSRVWFMKASTQEALEGTPRAAGYASALVLTLTNPPTIVAFAAIFTVFVPVSGIDARAAVALVVGVFAGSTIWWLALTATISAIRHVIGTAATRWIDRASGTVLALFGGAELREAL